jgi:PPK2 family polyphosphate:nucleotide phosphotransferase
MGYAKKIGPGEKIDLGKFDTSQDGGLEKLLGEKKQLEMAVRLGELQELMFAAGQHSLLIVLQGRDTSGKDGTIRCLLQSMNAQSTRVAPFKVPTPEELAHDFLWRVHEKTPGKGETVIFNRSHYEDVLVVRVHGFAPEEVWSKRYEHINRFEKLLADSNTIIAKFCLCISKDEQRERLIAREGEAEKAWKLSVGDWKERAFWDDYTTAYSDAIEKCATDVAPWHVIAADKKWFRNLAITEALIACLEPYEKGWTQKLNDLGTAMRAEIEEFRTANPDA